MVDFLTLSSVMMNGLSGLQNATSKHKFYTLFGVSERLCRIIMDELLIHGFKHSPTHVLWGLLFLKVYGTEYVHSQLTNTNPKEFRDNAWEVIRNISKLPIVSRYYFHFFERRQTVSNINFNISDSNAL